MSFKHKAVYGQTGMGKSWLMKRRVAVLRKRKQICIYWTATAERDFAPGTHVVDDIDKLEAMLGDPVYFNAFVFLDEAAVLYDEARRKDHPNIHGLFMRGRHKGLTVFIGTQYPTSIPRRNRINCGEAYCFRLGDHDAAQQVWRDYGCPDYNGQPIYKLIPNLPKLHFFRIVQPDICELLTL